MRYADNDPVQSNGVKLPKRVSTPGPRALLPRPASFPLLPTPAPDTFAVVSRLAQRANSEPNNVLGSPAPAATRASLARSSNMAAVGRLPAATAVAWGLTIDPLQERRLSAFAGERALHPDVAPPKPIKRDADYPIVLPAMRVALRALAREPDVRDKVIRIDSGNCTILMAGDQPGDHAWYMDFDIHRARTAPHIDTAFYGLRTYTRGVPGAAAKVLAAKALGAFRAAFDDANFEVDPCTTVPRIAVFSSDYNTYLGRDDLLAIFGEESYAFDWETAKNNCRSDRNKSTTIVKLEEAISRDTGFPFVFNNEEVIRQPNLQRDIQPSAVGLAKMWCINALREKYFYEPVLKRAALVVASKLVEAWGAGAAPGNAFTEVTHKWQGLAQYTCEAQEVDPKGRPVGTVASFGVEYQAVGSHECDSDIDCTVVLKPDAYLFEMFMSVVDGTDDKIGVSAEVLGELAQGIPNFISRSASRVFDINFYSPGFLRDEDTALVVSPFHTTTHDAGVIRLDLDRGAAITHLLTTQPLLLHDLLDLDNLSAPAALDYALYRVLRNSCSEGTFILDLANRMPADPETAPLFAKLREALAKVIAPDPLTRMRKGPMTSSERLHALSEVAAIGEAIRNISARDITRKGIPIVETAKHALTAEYARSLARVAHERDALLSDAITHANEDSNNTPAVVDLRATLDHLALRAIDLQVALSSEAPEAYASDAAVQRNVKGRQQHIPQIADAFIAAIAATEDASYVAAHATSDHYHDLKTTFEQASRDEHRLAYAKYLIKVAKYLDRILCSARDVDTFFWDHNFAGDGFDVTPERRLSNDHLEDFAEGLASAKELKAEDLALRYADKHGFESDVEIRQLCFKLARYAHQRSRSLDASAHLSIRSYRATIDELRERIHAASED